MLGCPVHSAVVSRMHDALVPSQATVSVYESGGKVPSVETLTRLLAATGCRLAVEPGAAREPSRQEHERTARALADVLALAEALPKRHRRELRYPGLAA